MDKITDRSRRLADYIYDDLGPEELAEMEREISADSQLSESYRLNMQVKKYLQAKVQLEEMRSDPQLEHAAELAEMAFEVDPREEENRPAFTSAPKRNRVRNLSIALAAVATVSIIMTVGILPFGNRDRLFDRYYEPMEASDYSQRGASTGLYRAVATGINDYMDGNYRQSIDRFNQLAADPLIQPEVQLFTALSYMGLGQFKQAGQVLESAVESNTRYMPEILWYLSLCYLKTGEVDRATTLLSRLENYEGLYKNDAHSLQKKLRRFKQ